MVGHEGSSAGSYLADPTSPIPSHCASIVVTSTVRVKMTTDQCMVTDHEKQATCSVIMKKRHVEYIRSRKWQDECVTVVEHSGRAQW